MPSDDLIGQALTGNQRAVSRLATLLENGQVQDSSDLDRLHAAAGKAHVIGFTGPPGAGKSSLVGSLARTLLLQGARVAVIAVDPSSPLSGGATLGDRIRMSEISTAPGLFIRSMASRDRQDGLSPAIVPIIHLFDAAGYDFVIVETVGAGQNQTEIKELVHTLVLVEAPGAGDSVQALKAGLMEVADSYVVNKADLPGAQLLARDLRAILVMGNHPAENEFVPSVLLCSSETGDGIDKLAAELERHRKWLDASGGWRDRQRRIASSEIRRSVNELINRAIQTATLDGENPMVNAVAARTISPRAAALEILAQASRNQSQQRPVTD